MMAQLWNPSLHNVPKSHGIGKGKSREGYGYPEALSYHHINLCKATCKESLEKVCAVKTCLFLNLSPIILSLY